MRGSYFPRGLSETLFSCIGGTRRRYRMRRCIGAWLLVTVTSHLCLFRFSLRCYFVHGGLHLKQSSITSWTRCYEFNIQYRPILYFTISTLAGLRRASQKIRWHVLCFVHTWLDLWCKCRRQVWTGLYRYPLSFCYLSRGSTPFYSQEFPLQ